MKKVEQDLIVSDVVKEIYRQYPGLLEKFGQNGVERTEEDNYHHLDHLHSAYEMGQADLFLDYTMWLNTVLSSRGVGTHLIIDNFERLIRLIGQADMENRKEQLAYIEYLRQAVLYLQTLPN